MEEKDREKYIMNLLMALDQLGNAAVKGYHDETISSRLGKALLKKHAKGIIYGLTRVLSMLDANHCIDAIEWDEGESFETLFGKYIHHRSDNKH